VNEHQEIRPEVERATFCGNCGQAIDQDADECPSCGVDLCLDCGSPLRGDDEVCPACGAEFAFSCPECGEDLSADEEECPNCGYEFEDEMGGEEDDGNGNKLVFIE
jgi:predicted amidophosphoribosyltransferase